VFSLVFSLNLIRDLNPQAPGALPFQLTVMQQLNLTMNVSVGPIGIAQRYATPVGSFVVVSLTQTSDLRVLNASVDPAHPESRFAIVSGPLNVTAYGPPTMMCPRPGPGLSDRLLVNHGTGGLVEYSIDPSTGVISFLAKRVTVATAGVADSGSIVCAPGATTTERTIYCFNNTWGLLATIQMPATDYFNWTSLADTDLPGGEYKVGVVVAGSSPSPLTL
jgi:hypothetical protein